MTAFLKIFLSCIFLDKEITKKKFLPTGKVGLMKHARADANYAILTKQVKLSHEKKPALNLLGIYAKCRL